MHKKGKKESKMSPHSTGEKSKKENKSPTGNLNSTFIEELGSNSKSYDHRQLVRQIEVVVEIHLTVVEVEVPPILIEVHQNEQCYHQIVGSLVVVVEDHILVGMVVDLILFVVEQQLVEEQSIVEQLEQVQALIVEMI
jgi:hypothetical protein